MSAQPLPGAAAGQDALLARSVLALAAQVEAAELDIKRAILAAARTGDSARVELIVSRWLTLPAAQVLSEST